MSCGQKNHPDQPILLIKKTNGASQQQKKTHLMDYLSFDEVVFINSIGKKDNRHNFPRAASTRTNEALFLEQRLQP